MDRSSSKTLSLAGRVILIHISLRYNTVETGQNVIACRDTRDVDTTVSYV